MIFSVSVALRSRIRDEKGTQTQTFWSDIFRWGRGLPREGVGAKKFGMSLETREIKLFWRDIPGFCRDIPGVPEKFEKKKFVFNFRPLFLEGLHGTGNGTNATGGSTILKLIWGGNLRYLPGFRDLQPYETWKFRICSESVSGVFFFDFFQISLRKCLTVLGAPPTKGAGESNTQLS